MKGIFYTFITKRQRGVLTALLRSLLIPFYLLYGAVIWMRNFCYTSGIIKQKQLPCQVISVGNIVAGGTGKTPAVIAIAKLLQENSCKVGVLLRGYKGKSNSKITFVSDGEKLLCTRDECGDEADMIARHLTNIPVAVGKKRYRTGKAVIERFACDMLILDDGFQHRQLSRDLDILTVDATQPYGTGKMLPIGTLREPKSSIQRADLILLTRTEIPNIDIAKIKTELNRIAPNTPILESVHEPTSLYLLNQQGENLSLHVDYLKNKRILAVCGIGNPNAFVSTLRKYNPETVELFAFADHHGYTMSDLQKIEQKMKQHQSEIVVITQKDEQKIASLSPDLPIVVLGIELVITDGVEVLMEFVQK